MGGVQVNATANITSRNEGQNYRRVDPARTVTFQDSYDVLTPSTSRDEAPRYDPSSLIGFQKDPQLQERQRQQQRVEHKNAKARIDLRDKLNANKRGRDQEEQPSSGTKKGTTSSLPHPAGG